MKICKTCGRPEGELRDDDEPRPGDDLACWSHVDSYAECYSPRDESALVAAFAALERLDEVTRERDSARRALADVAKDRDAVQLESARWQIRAEKAEGESFALREKYEATAARTERLECLLAKVGVSLQAMFFEEGEGDLWTCNDWLPPAKPRGKK